LGPAPDGRHERLIELNVEEVVTPTRVTVGPGIGFEALLALAAGRAGRAVVGAALRSAPARSGFG
jgi:hypothetical protein